MEEPEDKDEEKSESGSSLKSLLAGTNKELILLIASFVVMSIVAVLIVFLIAGPKNSDQTAKKNNDRQKQKDEKSDGKEAVFDKIPATFINTSDPDTLRVINVKIDLVLENAKQVASLENSPTLLVGRAEIDDLLLSKFSDKPASELQKPAVKDKLRRELEYEIQKIFAGSESKINIKRVLFRKYIIQ
ncbi:TPA: flagellar basal body-associated FliL family protein [Candidatus Poribacteria bacterium]|jgi:flagellar basal body-associated protein FliL|nr:flagellar basal body-associated FliL family protein [Candidatus Poribacteria bacterium]HIA70337.1 flagellar basal body-associated FliL family protein [Candidatus Poribacteria bacterium]HIB89033.1 flagellar basal body-associated FliL family protein [Candidatus Poribacteria bacterium]HIC03398.1 flagellar basal body-associated FliL family protein [Candidatus Poribacteria bacterium]HIN27691.1 flagellar basal body-associated FliL family protein [Candidatus Poribacteria bacterium]